MYLLKNRYIKERFFTEIDTEKEELIFREVENADKYQEDIDRTKEMPDDLDSEILVKLLNLLNQ